MTYSSSFLKALGDRDYIHQCTDESGLDELLTSTSSQPTSAYIGFDCTADSLHVGSLVQIMLLRLMQQHGITPVILMGGGTTKVGDPSGKDESRSILTPEQIQQNIAGIQSIFSQFIDMDKAILVNNADWLEGLNYIDFLRDVGKHFSINRMLTFDSVKLRLEREQTLSFLEFNYMLLQAYDFVELQKRHQCRLQLGGSDQWGNIVNGIELGRRMGTPELFGLTTPLITTASGAKMGKTADGAVWLSPEKLSSYDYWQFWRNTEDQDVALFLKLFTELPLDEVERLAALQGQEVNEAKKILAHEATKLCHGEQAAIDAAETARKVFEEGTTGQDLPSITLPKSLLKEGVPAFKLFVDAGLAESGGAARRLIRGGGAKLNDAKIETEDQLISLDALGAEEVIKLSAGKKKHALIRVE